MKPDIVMVGPMMTHVMEALDRDYTVHRLWEATDKAAMLADVANRVRGVATPGHVGADAALIDALPKLEIISCFAVGVDAVDLNRARERGVIVTNTPDVLTDCVADMTLGLLLASLRRICVGDRFVRSGNWRDGPMDLTTKVGGRRLGILGLGRIGKAVALRAAPFGLDIAYYGRRHQPDVPYRYYDSLEAMAADVDILAVTCPGGAATYRLVNGAVLDALGPQGTVINVSRGSVIDEPALVAALKDGRLGAAGLDVFEKEPHVPEVLLSMDNVVLQPHQGSATRETRQAMGDLVIENLQRHFAGQKVVTPVTQEAA